jgi:glycosyltransferase involved in cell wall biosynthesis
MDAACRMVEPLVSIVLVTNRNSPFMGETLKSVSGQTWRRWELIIVDDGGPDPSTLDGLAKTVPNCTVVHRQHGGTGMARNAGFAASRGELLVFLDDDDIWHPDRLRRQVAELGRDPGAVACYSSGWHIDAAGAELPFGWQATGATREQLLSGAVDIPRIVTLMVRREPFIAVGCFSTAIKIADDNELILRLLRYGRFACSPDALVGYRHYGTSLSKAVRVADLAVWCHRTILLQLWAAEASANQDDLRLMRQNMRMFRRRTAEALASAALVSAKSGHPLRAAGELACALGWSAPRAASVAATRLGRFARKQGQSRVWQARA